MFSLVDIDVDDSILEFLVGFGYIVDIIFEKYLENVFIVIEDYFDLVEVFKEKGYEVIKMDFL